MIDNLAQKFCSYPRQHFMTSGGNKQMPRLLWKDGITPLSELTASAKVGRLLTVVAIALTEQGRNIFSHALGSNQAVSDMVNCFQSLLGYWAWLKSDTFWYADDIVKRNQCKSQIKNLLRRLKQLWPRSSGQQWDLPKFHEQLHVPDTASGHLKVHTLVQRNITTSPM